jgi:hypothetical protein
MNKADTWARFLKMNPAFSSDAVTMTPSVLKKFFDKTWDVAHDHGFTNGRAFEAMNSKPSPAATPDFFEFLTKR